MVTRNCMYLLRAALLVLGLGFLVSPAVQAQTSTGAIRGYVTVDSTGAAVAAAEIQARNVSNGVSRSTTSRADGSYNLPGLVPSTYELTVRHIGMAASSRQVVVQIGATSLQNFALAEKVVEVEELTVTAAPPTIETRTSEVSTNVSQEQIKNLPSNSGNFLDLAQLAPGVTLSEDRIESQGRTFRGGAQAADNINVFIDGVSMKNDLTAGGVSGQDASRGNPFPRNAIQEFRVISQNFKAEYQKASSAIITATTKSGGNTWGGNVFVQYQNQDLVALDSFAIKSKNANPTGFKEPDYSRYLLGISAGGPIIKDRLHVFGSYEGNYQNRAQTVSFIAPTTGLYPALDTINFAGLAGQFQVPFRSTLFFGKLSYAVNPSSSLEFSVNTRHETDLKNLGTTVVEQATQHYLDNVTIGKVQYNIFRGAWLNEAQVSYQRFRRNFGPSAGQSVGFNFDLGAGGGGGVGSASLGANCCFQDFIQKKFGLRNDITYSGLHWGGSHVLKSGVSVDFAKYDINKQNGRTPTFFFTDSTFNGPDTTDYLYATPNRMSYSTGDPRIKVDNTQIGLYLQDDWSPTSQLTLNLGLRWDLETGMFNTKYVTPQGIADSIRQFADSFFIPIKNPDQFITDGTQRKPFYGAFQPRVGFSYALDKQDKTTVFGGFGIYYDRSLIDPANVDEKLKQTYANYNIEFAKPGDTPTGNQIAWDPTYLNGNRAQLDSLVTAQGRGEIWLIPNKPKVPHSRQWNVGLRRVLGEFVAQVTYAGVRSVDGLTGNVATGGLNPNGTCCNFPASPVGTGVIYFTNEGRTWYDALEIQLDRPFRRTGKIGWGAGIAFTYAKSSTAGADNPGDFLAFPQVATIPRHPNYQDKFKVLTHWISEVPFLGGLTFSGLIDLRSGVPFDAGGRLDPAQYHPAFGKPKRKNFIIPGAFAYRNVDVRLVKDFPSFGAGKVSVTGDLFNVFNYQNLGCFSNPGFVGNTPPAGFGDANCVIADARRFQLGVQYTF